MKRLVGLILFLGMVMLGSCSAPQEEGISNEELYSHFQTPPASALPRVWWHWMDGNITKDGIYKDLMWMKNNDIAGFMNFDAGMTTPQIVPERLIYMTPEWKDAFAYTVHLADSLGLEMSVASSPGWSFTGGPWVKKEDAMKKIVWREIRLKGGQKFDGELPQPYDNTGAYQNLSNGDTIRFYKDIEVLAYRLPAEDVDFVSMNPKVTSSGGNFTLEQLTDGDLYKSIPLPAGTNGQSWIQYEFSEPQIVKALTIMDGRNRSEWAVPVIQINKYLQTSDDGANFTEAVKIPDGNLQVQTVSFPPVKGKYFRLVFDNNKPTEKGVSVPLNIAEFSLSPVTRINHSEEKAGYASPADLYKFETPLETNVVSSKDIIDLTTQVKDGKLIWDVPEGEWKIVRYGYSLTGKKNHPAPPEATGLEVDKMDARAVNDYFEHYINMYMDASKKMMGERGIQYLLTDSYEAGQETWTPRMFEEFQKRRGYDLRFWLPVLTGQIINSTEESEKFLFDWRKTIGELVIENHYDQLTTILAKYNMKRYSESQENGRIYLADGMSVKRTAGIPMSAAWMPHKTGLSSTIAMSKADIRESASVAHIYGQNINAAESFTIGGFENNAWSYYPGNLKMLADIEMSAGLNRFVVHTSPHQPVDDKFPGLGLGPFGQWFDRHDTWADNAKYWTDYLGRSCYMLQQGKFVADILYYYGEDNNITGLFGAALPDVPKGYNFDFVNAEALLNEVDCKKGELVVSSGMHYKVLVLDKNVKRMSLPVLKRIAELVKKGAVVCGAVPEMDASLSDDQNQFIELVKSTFGGVNKNVYAHVGMAEALKDINVEPDVILNDDTLRYVHRTLPSQEIYWINNPDSQAKTVHISFRVKGMKPELWHPETGEKNEVSYKIKDNRTEVTFDMVQEDAVFVVFSGKPDMNEVTVSKSEWMDLTTLAGPWHVQFQAKKCAPESVDMDQLYDWTTSSNAAIKYFSGTAIYTTNIDLSADVLKNDVMLDLGDVDNMADVTVNGQHVGFLWKAPYIIDVTKTMRTGKNEIEIKVTNTWANRLIGDEQPGIKQRITYTAFQFYKADAPLRPAGLVGPVILKIRR